MPLATEKTWEFDVNNSVFPLGGGRTDNEDFSNDQRQVFFGIKEAMIGNGSYTDAALASLGGLSTPWNVEGSSDFVAAGMDSVDRITDPLTDLRMSQKGSAQAHSWIVLSNSQIGGSGIHVLFNHEATNNSNGALMDVLVSQVGFTGGSITARPTATDEVVLCNGNTFGLEGSWGVGSNSTEAKGYSWHFMQSSDGQCCRVVIIHRQQPVGFWMFDTVKDPVTGWAEAFVSCVAGLNSNTDPTPTRANFYSGTARLISLRSGIGLVRCFATEQGFGTGGLTPLGARFIGRNDQTGEFHASGVGVASTTAGFVGRHGRLFDLFWGPQGRRVGTLYPSSTFKFTQFGELILPWVNTQLFLA